MNYIDVYLQKNHLTRYDVHKIAGISQQTLASASRKEPETYSGKILMALSQATKDSPGTVLDELIMIRNSSDKYVVTNWKELEEAVGNKIQEIIVVGDFTTIIKEIKKNQLPENSKLGFELGSSLFIKLFEYGIESIMTLFEDGDKKINFLKNKVLRLYTIILQNNKNILLQLKSLDY